MREVPSPRTGPPHERILSMHGASSDRPALARGAGQRLLVVAGHPEVAELLSTTLELAGYRTVTVAAAADGVARLTRERFDLVIVDATLPDVTELGAARPALARRPPVLLLTDYESLGQIVPELGLGERDYVTKPFRVADVLARVQVLLRGTGAGPARGGTLSYRDLVLDDTLCEARRGPRVPASTRIHDGCGSAPARPGRPCGAAGRRAARSRCRHGGHPRRTGRSAPWTAPGGR